MNEEINTKKKKSGVWKRFFANIGFGILFGICAGIAFFGVKLAYDVLPVEELLVEFGFVKISESKEPKLSAIFGDEGVVVSQMDVMEIGEEEVNQLIEEQKEYFHNHVKINHGVYTDGDGCSYNSIEEY